MRFIHIYCDGGFGNRFNGLISGLLLAKAADLTPLVVWPRNNWCGASFDQLFDYKATVIERELATYVPEKERYQFFMTEDHLKMGVQNHSPLQMRTLADGLTYLRQSHKTIYFHTPLIPPMFSQADVLEQVRHLRLQPELHAIATKFIQTKGLSNYFGMQIRKTDFGNNATDENNLYGLALQSPTLQFFVCSDSQDVEQRFMLLPNVVTYPKRSYVQKMVDGDWNSAAADHSGRVYACNVNRDATSVEDAVVDLIILARSQIIQTSHSTFLRTALLLKQAGADSPLPTPQPIRIDNLDMASLDAYFDSHMEYQGRPVQVTITRKQHEQLFERLRRQWTSYGSHSPYSSVLSESKYLPETVAEHLDEFYASGTTPVSWLKTLAKRNDVPLPRGICFELGCGVGRITHPLSSLFDKVIAADISPGNLTICKTHLSHMGRNNIETHLLASPHDIEYIEPFDVFFSVIVLQHNPPPIQYYLLDQIMRKVKPGGLCLFQTLTYNPSYAYTVEMQLGLDDAQFDSWSIHCLPMRYIMALLSKHQLTPLEIVQDGQARGMQNKFHSHTFFARKETAYL